MLLRQLRLLAAILGLAALALVVFRKSSYDYTQFKLPKGWADVAGPNGNINNPDSVNVEQQHEQEGREGQDDHHEVHAVPSPTVTPTATMVEAPTPTASVDDASETPSVVSSSVQLEPKPTASASASASVSAPFDAANLDWSRFAYTQYVTDSYYLCNSVMIFEALHRMGSRPDRVMMYPFFMLQDPDKVEGRSFNERLIIKARDEYKVKLVPVTIEHRDNLFDDTWADSYTKLLAFNQTQYDRVLALDSDSTLLQPMDELFLLPPCPVAMPRAYWLLNDDPPKKILSSQVMLLQPSTAEFDRIHERVHLAGDNEYDMEIVNQLYLDSALVLPHRPYDMLSAEFRRPIHAHADYLGSDSEPWDPVSAYNEAKLVHFSDWPVPKPWIPMTDSERGEHQPACSERDGAQDCSEREIWNALYNDFATQRHKVCSLEGKPSTKARSLSV